MNTRGSYFYLLVTFLVAVHCAVIIEVSDEEWEAFKAKHERRYKDEDEDAFRKSLYKLKKEMIEAHNSLYEKGEVLFQMELNHFSDLTAEESVHRVCGNVIKNAMKNYKEDEGEFIQSSPTTTNMTLPSSVDWRNQGAVTPIKDQGHCQSCWTFSTTGTLEGQWKIKKGKLVSLSEKQILDCDGGSCSQGGLPSQAIGYIQKAGGIESEESYPYVDSAGSCKFLAKKVVATTTGVVGVTANENALQEAVANIGPISVAIDASQASFHHYTNGIYKEPKCGKCNSLDHAVLVVGYGEDNGNKYWLIKNSWGTSWGLDGYMKMARDDNNMCGIACEAVYPSV